MNTIHLIILFLHGFTYALIHLFTYLAQTYNRNLLNARIQRIKISFFLKNLSSGREEGYRQIIMNSIA